MEKTLNFNKVLRIVCRDRLTRRASKDFLEWASDDDPNYEMHHILGSRIGRGKKFDEYKNPRGKLNDYFLYRISKKIHDEKDFPPFVEMYKGAVELQIKYFNYLTLQELPIKEAINANLVLFDLDVERFIEETERFLDSIALAEVKLRELNKRRETWDRK